jgi:hypothetical protein
VTGAAGNGADGAVLAPLASLIARLSGDETLAVAEFGPDSIIVWEIHLDLNGTPRVRYWPEQWESLHDAYGMLAEQELIRFIQPGQRSPRMLVRSGAASMAADQALGIASASFPGATTLHGPSPLRYLLAEAVSRVPISQWYELVVLRPAPSGELVLTAELLFPPEATRGDTQAITLRCEPSDEDGTVFAVVCRGSEPSFRLVSMDSARVPPSTYHVTATLLRPGAVRFGGLPVKLARDPRNWQEVLDTVPARFEATEPVHLIIAIESCGTDEQVFERVHWAGQFVRDVAGGAAGPVTYSLVGYGAHSFMHGTRDDPVEMLGWADETDTVLDGLNLLTARGGTEAGYSRAARIECMLARVAGELSQDHSPAGRPVLVTVGTRPAFPHRIDPASEIIPCPNRHDWRALLKDLRASHPGISFGAVHDPDPDADAAKPTADVWGHLGADALARTSMADSWQFAVELGLLPGASQYVPFPMSEYAEG